MRKEKTPFHTDKVSTAIYATSMDMQIRQMGNRMTASIADFHGYCRRLGKVDLGRTLVLFVVKTLLKDKIAVVLL